MDLSLGFQHMRKSSYKLGDGVRTAVTALNAFPAMSQSTVCARTVMQ
jgi:hypothetical protein